MRNARRNSSEILIKEEEYIEKKVNALSVYNVYWCLYELRKRGQLPTETILKNDSFCKLQLIRILKQRRYSVRSLNIFLEVSAENSIPLSYVKWFHDDTRAALWLKMVLINTINSSESIVTESDISIFIHDVIFNRKLFIRNNILSEYGSNNTEWIVLSKKIALAELKQIYLFTKVNEKDIKWLTSRNNDRNSKINYAYQYMQKAYDLNNLIRNKEKNNESENNTSQNSIKDASKNIDKSGYRQPLIYANSLSFPETETTARLCHILASLDYWTFNIVMNEDKAANRALFIKKMYDAWNSKQKRDRDTHKKNQGIDLTSDNKKNLKYLAKACGKTQREVLNDLVESAYSQIPHKGVQRNSSFLNQDNFFDSIPQTQPSSLQNRGNETEAVFENSSIIECQEEPSSTCSDKPLGHSKMHIDKYALNDTVETSQNSGLVKPFYPQESHDKNTVNEQSSADFNAQFIAAKEARKFR